MRNVGERVAWFYEPSDPENGPCGPTCVMEGFVASIRPDGMLVVDGFDERLHVISPEWLMEPDEMLSMDERRA